MGHGYSLDGSRRVNKKKLAIAALIVGAILLLVLAAVAVIIVAAVRALPGQADGSIGQIIGTIISTLWKYAMDVINALWQQVLANPLQFIMGGNN